MTDLNMKRFVRTPFQVRAVQITEENIEEIADLIGEIRTGADGRYIVINKRIVPSVNKAYVGYWLTEMDDNLRCYNPEVFEKQFMAMPEVGVACFRFPYNAGSRVDFISAADVRYGGDAVEVHNPNPNQASLMDDDPHIPEIFNRK